MHALRILRNTKESSDGEEEAAREGQGREARLLKESRREGVGLPGAAFATKISRANVSKPRLHLVTHTSDEERGVDGQISERTDDGEIRPWLDAQECADYWFAHIVRDGHVDSWARKRPSDIAGAAGEMLGMYARHFFRLFEFENPFTLGENRAADAMSAEILMGVLRRAKYARRARNNTREEAMNYYCTSAELEDNGDTVVKLQAHDEDGRPRGRVTLRASGDHGLGNFDPGERYFISSYGPPQAPLGGEVGSSAGDVQPQTETPSAGLLDETPPPAPGEGDVVDVAEKREESDIPY